jgi:hypothetical protein
MLRECANAAKPNSKAARLGMRRKLAIGSSLLVFGLCCGCSTAGRAEPAKSFARSLGFEGCRAFGPLTPEQAVAREKSMENNLAWPHPDWDSLMGKYASGDRICYIDCTGGSADGVVVGTSLYALTREGVASARALETIYD